MKWAVILSAIFVMLTGPGGRKTYVCVGSDCGGVVAVKDAPRYSGEPTEIIISNGTLFVHESAEDVVRKLEDAK
jgi:hypothetical protein